MTLAREVRFAARARAEASAIDAWWRENRTSSVDLFADELEACTRRVAELPTLGRIVRGRDMRRVLMQRTTYHVYFRIEGDVPFVLAVWHATRGSGPGDL